MAVLLVVAGVAYWFLPEPKPPLVVPNTATTAQWPVYGGDACGTRHANLDQITPGTTEADWSRPFTGTLASFNGQNWSGTLAVLDGSAGGTWLDVTGVLPQGANFVKFDVGADQQMFVDAVASSPIPEPTMMTLLGLAGLVVRRRR